MHLKLKSIYKLDLSKIFFKMIAANNSIHDLIQQNNNEELHKYIILLVLLKLI